MSPAAGAWLTFVVCLVVLVPLLLLGIRQSKRARAASDDDLEVQGLRPQSNFLAGAAFLFAFLASPLGILFAHLALRQITQSGAAGARLATAALFIAYALTVAQLALLLWGSLTGYFH